MNEKGFTLIELMIAVAIVGILLAVAIPSYQSYRVKSYYASAASDIRNLSLFEHSFYSDHQEYVAVVPSDKGADGVISKNVTLNNGSTELFEIRSLTPDVQIVVNTDGTRQYANFGAYHPGGDQILAIENDFSEFRKTDKSGTLVSADVPAATAANDLASWAKY